MSNSISFRALRSVFAVLLAAGVSLALAATNASAAASDCTPFGVAIYQGGDYNSPNPFSDSTGFSVPAASAGVESKVVMNCSGHVGPGTMTVEGAPGSPAISATNSDFVGGPVSGDDYKAFVLAGDYVEGGTYTVHYVDDAEVAADYALTVTAPFAGGGGGGGGGGGVLPTDCFMYSPGGDGISNERTLLKGMGGGDFFLVWCPSGFGSPSLSTVGAQDRRQLVVGAAVSHDCGAEFPIPGGECFRYRASGSYAAGDAFTVRFVQPAGHVGSEDYELTVAALPDFSLGDDAGPLCQGGETGECYVRPTSVAVEGVSETDRASIASSTFGRMGPNNWIGRALGVSFAGGGIYSVGAAERALGKEVTLTFNVGDYDPAVGVVRGGRHSSSAPWPNKTWHVSREAGGNILTIKFVPKATAIRWGCSVDLLALAECGGPTDYADRYGANVQLGFGDFTTGPFAANREISRGVTVTTTAQDHGPIVQNPVTKALSIATAGPHFIDSPDPLSWPTGVTEQRANDAFITMFIPERLATSPAGFGLPGGESMKNYIEVQRNGSTSGLDPQFEYTPGDGGGIYINVPSFGFSSPTITWKSKYSAPAPSAPIAEPVTPPVAAPIAAPIAAPVTTPAPPAAPAGPRAPKAALSVDSRSDTVRAVIRAEVGVVYSITASPFTSKAAAKKPAKLKKGKCVANRKKKTVTCALKLSRGRWTVSITPKKNGVAGTATKKVVRIR